MRFRSNGWHRTEPFAYEAREEPALYRRLVRRALAEQMITSEEADRLYPDARHHSEQQERLGDPCGTWHGVHLRSAIKCCEMHRSRWTET